jgi:hypothetical protein
LDRQDVYLSEEEDEKDHDKRWYIQAPNVPKEQVRELMTKLKEDYKKSRMVAPLMVKNATSKNSTLTMSNSLHTLLALFTSVTNTPKACEDIIGYREVTKDTVGLIFLVIKMAH